MTKSVGVLTMMLLAAAIPALAGSPSPESKSAPGPGATPVPEAAKPTPDWVSRMELGGTAFLFYRYELTTGARSMNSFELSRMYFFSVFKPTPHLKFRMTIDAPGRETPTTVKDGAATVNPNAGRFDVVLKHAFLEVSDVATNGLALKFGMHDLPWVPYEEKIWTYRFQGPVLADREGYLSSTDLGAGLSYVHPDKRLEAHLSLVNGETWTRPEISKQKTCTAA